MWGGVDGFVSPFYMQGQLNVMAVVANGAEALLAVCAASRYSTEGSVA